MATFLDLALGYAEKIQEALRKDRISTRGVILSSYNVKRTFTYSALVDIIQNIDLLVYTENSKPLSKEDKDRIYGLIQENLSLPRNFSITESIAKASNDDLTDLISTIDNMLKGGSK